MAKKKFESLDNIFESPKSINSVSVKKYKSNYDYSNVIEEDKEKLINSEEEIIINKDEINKSYFRIAKDLYEANKILASYDNTNGQFIKWFEFLGLKKTFVYNSIKRFELYLLTGDEEKINKLSQKAVEMIGSQKIDDSTKIKLLKTNGIENFENKTLKNQILDIISDRSEMIGSKDVIEEVKIAEETVSIEQRDKHLKLIKKLLNKVENKTNEEISKLQLEKLKRVEEILKEI